MPPTLPGALNRPDLVTLYACPSCRGAIETSPLHCIQCGRVFPIVDGRPILLERGTPVPAKRNSILAWQATVRLGAHRKGLKGLVDRFREVTTVSTFADDRTQVPILVERVLPFLPRTSPILEVGAGEQYYHKTLARLGPLVAMDISLYGATDVVGDGHHLPFRDTCLGAIVAIEVLEHLARPWVFFSEVQRTLLPGGVLFGVAPQYCPTHGFPDDYFRFTRGGLESLADTVGLKLIDAWSIGGRWGAMLHWYWANFARENRLRRVPGLNIVYHVWFQAVAAALDRLDRRDEHGGRLRQQEHNEQIGWSFIIRKPPE